MCNPWTILMLATGVSHAALWQGVCKGGVCVCHPGYRGAYCEIPPACSGILDAAGNCCPGGILSQIGTCCGVVRASSSVIPRLNTFPPCTLFTHGIAHLESTCWLDLGD